MRKQSQSSPSHVFALLIDADNTSIDLFPQMMQHIANWGTVTIRQVYGNHETLLSPKWKEACLQYALQPLVHVGISGAKNATDIALTVGAMDLLYKEDIASFCLVTGDQDFTALVLRLRSQGCQVYCIGRPSKAEALAKVCTELDPLFWKVQMGVRSSTLPTEKGEDSPEKNDDVDVGKSIQCMQKWYVSPGAGWENWCERCIPT
jgi:uncharacterized protein (TIGR00288 family)